MTIQTPSSAEPTGESTRGSHTEAHLQLIYRINARDEIIHVNQVWDQFAAENAAPAALIALAPNNLLGQSLWRYVTDAGTRQLYRSLLTRVRPEEIIRFTFRCDSPECRRRLQMEIQGNQDGTIEFRSTPVLIEPRPAQFLLDWSVPRSSSVLTVCSWCNRIKIDDKWWEIEEGVEHSALFEDERLPRLSHGICDDCYGVMRTVVN